MNALRFRQQVLKPCLFLKELTMSRSTEGKAMSETAKRDRPRRNAIIVGKDTHFYENAKTIEFFHWTTDRDGGRRCVSFRVSGKKLAETFPVRTALEAK